jgi:phosphatidylserine decarboxylase
MEMFWQLAGCQAVIGYLVYLGLAARLNEKPAEDIQVTFCRTLKFKYRDSTKRSGLLDPCDEK